MLETLERRRKHRDRFLENLDDEELIKDEEAYRYDEVISEDEKEDLHELIEWMSIE